MYLKATIIAAVTALAVLSGQSAGAPAALAVSTEYATTAGVMSAAGYGKLTAGRQFLAVRSRGRRARDRGARRSAHRDAGGRAGTRQ
jgi:hypothetical protein